MPTSLALAVGVGSIALLVAGWVVWRDRRTPANHLFAAGVCLFGIEGILVALSVDAGGAAEAIRLQQWASVTRGLAPGIWLAFSLAYSRGNATEFLRRWCTVLGAAFLLPLLVVVTAFDSLVVDAQIDFESGYWLFQLGLPGVVIRVFLLMASVLVLLNLERTLRAAAGTQRWRVKLVVLGVGLLFAVRIYTSSQVMLYRATEPFLDAMNAAALGAACALVLVSLIRTRVFGIEVYPSHAFLQRSLTMLLAGAYLLIVGLSAKVISYLGGTSAFHLKALLILVALVLLALMLMSDRVRHYLERFVSRHLRRPRYDYRQVWRTFTERTARHVREAEFCAAVVEWVSETFNVLTVSVWLVDAAKHNFRLTASTGIPGESAAEPESESVDEAVLIEVLRGRTEPFDVDQVQEKWAEVLGRFNPDYFRKGGGRITVPLNAGGELLGLMTLGDRVGGVRFAFEDLELLKSIGEQTASSLMNIQLSRRLLEAGEMEAFQTMSTFFVHDLKNVASTLSLMLKNLPVHFDKPEFRQDALKGIGRSVERMNDLIARLSELRSGLALKSVETDLNSVVEAALQMIDPVRLALIERSMGQPVRAAFDPELMQKVVTNLVLNALEAIDLQGRVQVSTAQGPGWAVLSVADNGCGMKREFLEKSLFRPFQTTKKKGIGIGMYQSRRIIEAHGGRIEVESEEGKGTTFRVFIPRGGVRGVDGV